jgi:hypothetical protein
MLHDAKLVNLKELNCSFILLICDYLISFRGYTWGNASLDGWHANNANHYQHCLKCREVYTQRYVFHKVLLLIFIGFIYVLYISFFQLKHEIPINFSCAQVESPVINSLPIIFHVSFFYPKLQCLRLSTKKDEISIHVIL